MQEAAWKENDLVLQRNQRFVCLTAYPCPILLVSVVQSKLTAFKRFRLSVEEIHVSELSSRDLFLGIVAVMPEEIAVIARRGLRLEPRDRERTHLKSFQHSRQSRFDARSKDLLKFPKVHQYARTTVFRVDDPADNAGRNHLADLEVPFV